jgi:uncharacterized protein YhjY with autotransporter beta-barrel domain
MTRFTTSLWLSLATFVSAGSLAQAQFVFQFEQQGGNTVVTGSGSGTTGANGGVPALIGFHSGNPGTGPLFVPNFVPAGWVENSFIDNQSNNLFPDPSLGIGALRIHGLFYHSGPSPEDNFFYLVANLPVPASTNTSAFGTATFTNPFTSLFDSIAPGTVLQVIPGELHFIIGFASPVVAVTPVGSGRRQVQSYLLTDVAAIASANTSGLGMGLVNQQVVQGAADAALRDLNNRLYRARSGVDTSPGSLVSTLGGDSSLLRHLAFVQDENMSYKVALGLADPEERTVEVNAADTLSAQKGSNFSGQSFSGGLPYAMMGVPIMPMAGGAATVKIVEAAPSGKTVIDDSKAVVEIAPHNRWELFAAGDFSFYDQDQLSDLMEGFDTDTYAGSVGIEYRPKDWLNLGLAWSYLESDTNVSGNYGNIDLEGNLISSYATAFWRQYWADLLYSYGSFNSDINRNTGLGSQAHGDTDSQSHNIRLNFGRNFNVGNSITTGPIAGLQYANGDIDSYNERGGGAAALSYEGTDFESMVSRLGWQATHVRPTGWGRLVSQVHLAWEHEYMPENGTVGASLQTSPFALVTGSNISRFGGYSTESDGAYPGTDWLSAGVGLRFELAKGVAFLTDYEGVFFRSDSSQHYASAKLSYEWGSIIPNGGGGKAVSGKTVAYEAYDPSSKNVDAGKLTPEPEAVSKPVVTAAAEKDSPSTFASWLGRNHR